VDYVIIPMRVFGKLVKH